LRCRPGRGRENAPHARSGTWDFVSSLTYSGEAGVWGWGAQIGAVLRFNQLNDSGFRYGNQHQANLWVSRELTPWLSASLRLAGATQDIINGHYDGAHNHTSPPDIQPNYGGDFIDVGLGLNAVVLDGYRIGLEATLPVYERVNGFQQAREASLFASWARAF